MRKIIHIDMDCFYASVELKHRPELQGFPVAVGGPSDSRGVICTANYEARKFGVRAAIPSSQAVRLCPSLILLPPRFDLYRAESATVRHIFAKYTSKVEPLSLDEAYLDVTELCQSSKDRSRSATFVAHEIRRQIFQETRLKASAGIAPNKFLAKIASDWRKPNNQFTIKPDDVDKFMLELPVEKIFGVGPVTKRQLHGLSIKTCQDLQNCSPLRLKQLFGRRAAFMQDLSRGVDLREVKSESFRKSVSVEQTFSQDVNGLKDLQIKMTGLYEKFLQRYSNSQKIGPNSEPQNSCIRSWVVKLKYFDFQSVTHELHSDRLPQLQDFLGLLQECYPRRIAPVRLVGLGVRLREAAAKTANKDESQLIFF